MNFVYESERLYLKVLNESYSEEVLRFLSSHKDYFDTFEALKPANYYTDKYIKSNLRVELKAFLNLLYVRFYVFKKDEPDTIIGTISFNNFIRSPFDCATIGYKFSPEHQGHGYACEAVSCATLAMFRDGDLHRIQAFVQPDNTPSIRLLENIGYIKEGLCRKSICIQGEYKDHLLYSIVNPSA